VKGDFSRPLVAEEEAKKTERTIEKSVRKLEDA